MSDELTPDDISRDPNAPALSSRHRDAFLRFLPGEIYYPDSSTQAYDERIVKRAFADFFGDDVEVSGKKIVEAAKNVSSSISGYSESKFIETAQRAYARALRVPETSEVIKRDFSRD